MRSRLGPDGTGRRRVLLLAAVALAPLACARFDGRDGHHPTENDQIRFSHATHARAKVACLACHEEIYDAKTMEGRFLPPEAKCLECHKEKKAQGTALSATGTARTP